MVKKVLGGLFFAGALLMLIGAIANGSLFSDKGSAAATYGNFIGMIIPLVIYTLSGLFLFTFDNTTKLNYINGFKKRSKQASKFIIFIIAYGVLALLSFVGVGTSNTDNYILSYFIAVLPHLVSLAIFVSLFQMYALTHNASKKYFVNSDNALNEYLSENEIFNAWSDDNFVLASNKALFFPTLFCVIPFDQISSLRLYNQLGEQGIFITLVNGKRIYIVTKHFDRIQEAVNAHQQTQQ